jgi:hypothetical protein
MRTNYKEKTMDHTSKVSTSQGPGSHFDHAQHNSNTSGEGASAPSCNCTLADIEYGAKIYVYMPINEKGEPQTGCMDVADARAAVEDGHAAAGVHFYYSRECGGEWREWEELKAHLQEAA